MDFSKFKTSDWLKVGGGVVFLIAGFMKWVDVDGVPGSANAFDFFFTGTVPWLLFVAVAVVTVLLVSGTLNARQAPWPLILLGATALGTLLVLIRFISPGAGAETGGFDVPWERGAGLILCLLAAIVATVGAFLAFQESGGSLQSLANRGGANRQQGGFPQPPPPPAPGGGYQPPAPPSRQAPPPPPAPPHGDQSPPPPPRG